MLMVERTRRFNFYCHPDLSEKYISIMRKHRDYVSRIVGRTINPVILTRDPDPRYVIEGYIKEDNMDDFVKILNEESGNDLVTICIH